MTCTLLSLPFRDRCKCVKSPYTCAGHAFHTGEMSVIGRSCDSISGSVPSVVAYLAAAWLLGRDSTTPFKPVRLAVSLHIAHDFLLYGGYRNISELTSEFTDLARLYRAASCGLMGWASYARDHLCRPNRYCSDRSQHYWGIGAIQCLLWRNSSF